MCICKPNQLTSLNVTTSLMLQPEPIVFSKIKFSIKCSLSSSVSERLTAKGLYYIAYKYFNTSAITYDKLIVIALT